MQINSVDTVQIGKHTWVSGLIWVPLTRQRDLAGDAKTQMRKFGGDAYVVRHGSGVAQVGIASGTGGKTNGALTLAGAVANTIAQREFPVGGRRERLNDWIGFFEVGPDRWFLMAVRDGSIVANCDRIASYAEAYDLLEQTYGIGGWSAVLGSPSIPRDAQESYHNFVALGIEEVIGLRNNQLPKAGQYKLRAPGNPKALIIGVVAVALVAVAGVAGWKVYQQHLADKQAAELASLQAQMAASSQPVQQKVRVPVPHGWASAATNKSLITQCVAHLDIPAAPGSWNLTGYACDGSGSTVTLTRPDISTVGYLKALLSEAQVTADQNSATWVRPFSDLEMHDEPLIPYAEMETAIFSRMQMAKVTITVGAPTPPPPPPIPPEQADKVEIIPADWNERTLSVGPTPLMPDTVLQMVEFPGVRIKKITTKDGKWTYEGTIYAK